MARDARCRTWDLDCLEETSVLRQENEPLILPGCTREIPSLNFDSIVLPKEAFFTSNDAGARLRARGRGRSLTNRALGLDKPSRRPGEKDISHKGNSTVENPKPTTLGSQFLGSKYLYKELFPSLDQSSSKISVPSKPPVWCGKQKSKKGQQSNEQETNNGSSTFEKSTRDKFESKQSDGLENNTNNGQKNCTPFLEREILEQSCVDSDTNINEIKLPSSTFYNCANDVVSNVKTFVETEDKPIGSDQVNVSEISMNVTTETSDTNASENDSQSNMVGFGRIEPISSDWQSDEEEFGTIENTISLQSSSLENIDSVDCLTTTESEELHKDKQSEKLNIVSHKLEIDNDQNSNPKDYVQEIQWIDSENDQFAEQCNKVNIQMSDCLEVEDDQNSTGLKDDNFQETNWIESKDNLLFEKYGNDEISNHLLDQLQLEEIDSVQNYNSNYSCDADYNQPTEDSSTMISASTNHLLSQSDSEGCADANDRKENLEESLNMSTSDVETEPCNVLLENLPLALTKEELQEIVEPYGVMESYNFNINKDSSKTCTVRMPNSMSGELLVVSLDGLEMDGYRIKAQIDET